MKYCFVVNPSAGKGVPVKKIPEIEAACASAGAEHEIHLTESKEDTLEYVRKVTRNGPVRVYSVGGDGTLNDVLNGVEDLENTEIGCMPCGTGNDFIKCFKAAPHELMDPGLQISAPSRRLDYISVSGLRCLNILNIGLDSNAAYFMQQYKKLPFMRGPAPYYLGVLKSLFKKLGTPLKVTADGKEPISGEFMLGVVANGQYYGGAYRAAPTARPDDGKLVMLLIDKVSRLKVIKLIGIYKKGEHIGAPEFKGLMRYFEIESALIESGEELQICVDGEVISVSGALDIKVHPGAVRFILPENA